ncbi:MAG TPA: CopD family protein [Steroidobacteraceae bacterium]|nr:CopD family protein [Steroidobacteraceae bacterium]
MRVELLLHVISDVVWVGGMFMAYLAVRPAALETLEAPQRLRLWAAIFARFFRWVWVAMILILGTGFSMMGRMPVVPGNVQAMAGVGVLMCAIFIYVYFVPFGRLRHAVAYEDWQRGGGALDQIRILVGVNLALGLANIALAVLRPPA